MRQKGRNIYYSSQVDRNFLDIPQYFVRFSLRCPPDTQIFNRVSRFSYTGSINESKGDTFNKNRIFNGIFAGIGVS